MLIVKGISKLETIISNGTNALKLRPYQEKAVQAVNQYAKPAPIVVAATGAGKTIIADTIAVQRLEKGPVLFLAHREELLDQTLEKFRAVYDSIAEKGQSVSVGKIQASSDEAEADFIVSSVQTLSQDRRLDHLLESHKFISTLITDEAHHAAAPSYKKIYKALGFVKEDQTTNDHMHLGLTATPYRMDHKSLSGVFDGVASSISMWDLFGEGYLVPPRSSKLSILDDLNVKESGDWSDQEVNESVNQSEVNEKIVDAWQEQAFDRLTIAFCASVSHALALAEEFRSRGIKAATITGATPSDKRRELLNDFSHGNIQVLTNYGVLTEGFDRPEVSCLIMSRPTLSHGLYIQMLGRGLRIAPHVGKQDCLVLDVVGTSDVHKLITVDTLTAEHEEEEEAAKKLAKNGLKRESKNRLHKVSAAQYRWMRVQNNVWLGKDFDGNFVRVVNDKDQWLVATGVWSSYEKGNDNLYADVVYNGANSELAWGYAATYARINLAKSAVGIAERWMEDRPTEKQVNTLLRRGVPVPETRWEAAMALTKPTPKQHKTLFHFFERHQISMDWFPDTVEEAGAMIDVCVGAGWLDVRSILRGWEVVLPHRYKMVQALQAGRENKSAAIA